MLFFFFFSSRRRHTIWPRDWSSDVCSSDLRAEVGGAARRHEGPGRACAVVVWWAEQEVAPFRILMPVVPRHVLVYHGPRRGMHGDVLDHSLADHPDAATVAERLAILAARSHRRLSYPNDPGHACRHAFLIDKAARAGGSCRCRSCAHSPPTRAFVVVTSWR